MTEQPDRTDSSADALAAMAAAGARNDQPDRDAERAEMELPEDAGDALAALEASGAHDVSAAAAEADVTAALNSGLPEDAGEALAALEASGVLDISAAPGEADATTVLGGAPEDAGDALATLGRTAAVPTGNVAATAPGAVRRRAGNAARDRAAANRFRKTMIPVLLSLAGVLFLVGGLSAAMASGAGVFENMGPNTMARARILAFCAFPIGVILVVGAMVFHREVSRGKKPR